MNHKPKKATTTTVGLANATRRILRWLGVTEGRLTTAPPSEDQVVSDLLELANAADNQLQLSTDARLVRVAVQRLTEARSFYLAVEAEVLEARSHERDEACQPVFIGPDEDVDPARLRPGVVVRRWTETVRECCRIAVPCHPNQHIVLSSEEQTRAVLCRTCSAGYTLHLFDEGDGGFAANLVVTDDLPILTRAVRTPRTTRP